jgi:hypothetical protein
VANGAVPHSWLPRARHLFDDGVCSAASCNLVTRWGGLPRRCIREAKHDLSSTRSAAKRTRGAAFGISALVKLESRPFQLPAQGQEGAELVEGMEPLGYASTVLLAVWR